MCVACGLPTTHSSTAQILGTLTLVSFTLTTFIGAWWILTSVKLIEQCKRLWRKIEALGVALNKKSIF